MNSQVREKLIEVVQAGDATLLRDASRVRALLADAVPDATREIAALAAAVEENVPPSISRASESLSLQGSLDRLARALADNRALALGAATWAVRSWAWALQKGPPPDDAAADTDGGTPPTMRAAPRHTLRHILTTYGAGVQRDASRLRALLADLAPGFRREQAALVAAVEEGIADRIVARSQPDGPLPVPQLADRLVHGQALSADAATWSIMSWAWALGQGPEPSDVVTDAPSDGVPPPPYRPSPPPPRSDQPAGSGTAGVPPWAPPVAVADETTVPQGHGAGGPPGHPGYPGRPPGHPGGPPGHPGGPPGHPGYPGGPPGHPGGAAVPPPGPPQAKPRRRVWPIVIGVMILVGGGTTAAVAAASGDSGDSGSEWPYPTTTTTTYTPPPTIQTTTPDVPIETTTQATTWAVDIASTFYAPADSCRTVTPEVAGVEYAMRCVLDTDGNGASVDDTVTVQYMGWSSLSALNTYLDGDAQNTGYTEDVWWFESDPSTARGRLIQFFYNDGDSGIDWSYESKLLTGEAFSSGSQATLHAWWRTSTAE